MLALHETRRDIALVESRHELGQAGVTVAILTLHPFFARHGITPKKAGHAVGQDRTDVLSAREDWFDRQLDLAPAKLGFTD